ncbi:Methylmalonyl-CoA carboxyltransferase 5S subunit [Novipirellula aureliae]|uniref:Methylmalonyl-CoA carboxyltransferase 5S subunit n=1 Tax=Novipirellula aureliae TaxID=2527966 RepID=A0A5C6DY19_9BACT|nr:oxaloacetate decarboxylase subunit alpha [Novipirellula aureliae]TWU40291.1 Methylmalonyl-CoA carboxyltransferase 5S subunit [Novipirellula aureliae]
MPSVNLIDTSLRDGHQSLLATRMSTEQCMRVLPMLVDSGYDILELWGGATLDSCLRFTGDDPFERLEAFRETCDSSGRKIQIRSLCRGQNLFGYNPYPDNLVYEFIKEACRTGNDRVRIFDALNDHRNLITAIMSTKTFNGHAEAALSYTTSPVHDQAHFVNFAKRCVDAGADSLAIKDMAGLLHPADAWTLIGALKESFPGVEITLHSHDTNGLAIASYVVGLMAGVSNLDTAYGPMAGATSQPPAELIRYFADALGVELNVNFDRASEIDNELRQIRTELKEVDKNADSFGNPWPSEPTDAMKAAINEAIELLGSKDHDQCTKACDVIEEKIMVPHGYPEIDKSQLESQIPGGMLSNLYNQLKDQGKLELMPKVQEEIPRVRAAAGYLPLVTPTSQIVGTQAVFNVMKDNPYELVSEPFRDVIMGKYGKLPGRPDPEVVKKCSRGQAVYKGRPADLVDDLDLEKVYQENGNLLKSHRDLLLLLLFQMPAKQFLQKREAESA